jgi:radical SAM-linked protein
MVPVVAGVHDRAWVEVMRGCTRGCRFCQAGMWYRPVRERPPAEVLAMSAAQLAATGHQELVFASLSTTDYSGLQELLSTMARSHAEVNLSLPSLRVDSASVRLAWLASPSGSSLTLAPEAGSQRMRNIINKNVTEEDIMTAVEEALRMGRTTLKLYFMIGLPWETADDVVAIADLCLRIRDAGRRALGARAGRLQLNVSVNTFVPKPFTPFQWAAMPDRETVLHRQGLLRSRLRRPGIRLALSDPAKSYLEAALTRGGEEMGSVIEGAWKRGARFDCWTEQFNAEAWGEAFSEAKTTAEALATIPATEEQPFPWDVVEGAPDRSFLWAEWERACRAEPSGDCRWDGCQLCGACETPPGNELAQAAAMPAPLGGPADETGGGDAVGRGPAAEPGLPRRYVVHFSVTGRGRFLGHLDRVEAFRRAVRRAGGRLSLSGGIRPKPVLSLTLPLGVGVEGLDELCEFELAEEPDDGFAERLAAALPGHMRLASLRPYEGPGRLAARVRGASYRIQFAMAAAAGGSDDAPARQEADALQAGMLRFAQAREWVVEDEKEGRVRRVDVKAYVGAIHLSANDAGEHFLEYMAAVTPAGTARPALVLRALEMASGLALKPVAIVRTGIHFD